MYYLDKFCFICMNKSKLKHLFEVDTDGISHYSKLTSSVAEMNFKEMNNQRLICAECCVTLNTVYSFRQMCLRRKTSLLTYISQLQTPDHISGTIRICLKDIKPKLIVVKNRGGNGKVSYSFGGSKSQIKFQTESYKVNIDLPASRNEECESEDGDSSEHEDVTMDHVNEDAQSDVNSGEDVEHQTMMEDYSKYYMEFNNIDTEKQLLEEWKEDPKSDTETPQDGSTSQADTGTPEEPKETETTTIGTKLTIGKELHQCEIFQKSFNRTDSLTNNMQTQKSCEISKMNFLDTIRLTWHRLKQNGSTSLEDMGTTEEPNRSETITIETELIQNTAHDDFTVDHVNESAHSDFKVEDVEHETMMEDSSECYMEFNKIEIEEHQLEEVKEEPISDTETPQDGSTSRADTGISEDPKGIEETIFGNEFTQNTQKDNEGLHQCEICQKSFKDKDSLTNHIQIHKKSKHTNKIPYKCEICEMGFKQKYKMTRHMKTHYRVNLYECVICKRGLKTQATLTEHMKTHSSQSLYKCRICKKGFKFHSYLTEHKITHTINRPYECEICKKGFKLKSHLTGHMIIHSSKKPYKCDICKRSFKQKNILTTHMESHISERPYECEVCEKDFKIKCSLIEHMRTHSNERPYDCEICKKGFKSRNAVTKHMIVHSSKRPYKCDICMKGFKHKAHLTGHKVLHFSERPYGCEICGLRFKHNYYLSNHMKVHSNERPYECEICKKGFKLKSNLTHHTKSQSHMNSCIRQGKIQGGAKGAIAPS